MKRQIKQKKQEIQKEQKKSQDAKKGKTAAASGKRKKFPLYWICLGIYAALLALAGRSFLKYTDECLIQYENA